MQKVTNILTHTYTERERRARCVSVLVIHHLIAVPRDRFIRAVCFLIFIMRHKGLVMAIADAITHMDVAVICIENVKLVNKIFVHYIFSRWALSLFPLCRQCMNGCVCI